VSLASPPSQNLLPQRIVLRHRVAVIDTVTLKLRLERLPAVCDRPHVLRPNTALLDAEDPLGETVGQQPKSFGAGIYAYCIAKRLAETWRTRRVQTEIAGVPLVLRIAVIGWLHTKRIQRLKPGDGLFFATDATLGIVGLSFAHRRTYFAARELHPLFQDTAIATLALCRCGFMDQFLVDGVLFAICRREPL
jgi:hypothetical protein